MCFCVFVAQVWIHAEEKIIVLMLFCRRSWQKQYQDNLFSFTGETIYVDAGLHHYVAI